MSDTTVADPKNWIWPVAKSPDVSDEPTWYELRNFAYVDIEKITPSKVSQYYGDNCWYLHTHKPEFLETSIWLYMMVDEPNGSSPSTRQITRRVLCEWYGRHGGIIILYGPTPADTKLWSFGCTHPNPKKKSLGTCYSEYSCECGAKWRVDSSG